MSAGEDQQWNWPPGRQAGARGRGSTQCCWRPQVPVAGCSPAIAARVSASGSGRLVSTIRVSSICSRGGAGQGRHGCEAYVSSGRGSRWMADANALCTDTQPRPHTLRRSVHATPHNPPQAIQLHKPSPPSPPIHPPGGSSAGCQSRAPLRQPPPGGPAPPTCS